MRDVLAFKKKERGMRKLFCFLVVMLFLCGNCWAVTQPSNGGFETGDLTDWEVEELECDDGAVCIEDVNAAAAQRGDYGLLLSVDASEGTFPWSVARVDSEAMLVPIGAVSIQAKFHIKVDAWPEPEEGSSIGGRCFMTIKHCDAAVGWLFISELGVTEFPPSQAEEHDDLELETWTQYVFDTDLTSCSGDTGVRPESVHWRDAEDLPMECEWDNFVVTYGF